MDVGAAFLDRSRRYLMADYLPRIRIAVGRLSEAALWWRPNEASNSVGNLLLHLAGNVRQWVGAGVGRKPDVRRREEEFARRGGVTREALLAHLEAAVEEADAVLSGLDPSALLERRVIQGMEVTVLEAVYHAVEHFSTHTGQILYITKLRTGEDLGFWEMRHGKAIPRWEERERP